MPADRLLRRGPSGFLVPCREEARGRSVTASPEGGFALALVVLLLFAIAVAGAAGYQVVRNEAFQAQQSRETTQALAVAHGGLEWFFADHRGRVTDSTVYSNNGGTAVVKPRKVATLSSDQDLYLVSSQGSCTDPRFPQIPTTRTVHQYATYKKAPVKTLAPLMTSSGTVRIRNGARVYGWDQASAGQCSGAPASVIAGVVMRTSLQVYYGGVVVGNPTGKPLGSFQTVADSVGAAWAVYADPTFEVDYDDRWPDFSSLPSTSYPVVRVNGNFSPTSYRSGRGVLIVTGTLTIPAYGWWSWNGIVMAGNIADAGITGYFTLYGALVGGLGTQMGDVAFDQGYIFYHSCYVKWAGESLAHFSPISNTWWEEF